MTWIQFSEFALEKPDIVLRSCLPVTPASRQRWQEVASQQLEGQLARSRHRGRSCERLFQQSGGGKNQLPKVILGLPQLCQGKHSPLHTFSIYTGMFLVLSVYIVYSLFIYDYPLFFISHYKLQGLGTWETPQQEEAMARPRRSWVLYFPGCNDWLKVGRRIQSELRGPMLDHSMKGTKGVLIMSSCLHIGLKASTLLQPLADL